MLGSQIQPFSIYIDRSDRCAYGGGNLYAEPTNSPNPYNHGDVVGA